MNALGIYRAKRFSPGKSENDKMILDNTLDLLRKGGWETVTLTEEELLMHHGITDGSPIPQRYLTEADCILSMARSEDALTVLENKRCINSPQGIRGCSHRLYLNDSATCSFPCWLKRADGCAEEKDDVCFCNSQEVLNEMIMNFKRRGIAHYIIQPHYEGDLVKFYGVAGTDFLHISYPTETGQTKFGLEVHNSTCRHFTFDRAALKQKTDLTALELNVPIYGGDAVIDADGNINIIDFNDWPTFSPCRKEAAKAIAAFVNSLFC